MYDFSMYFQPVVTLLNDPIFTILIQFISFVILAKIIINLTQSLFLQNKFHYKTCLFWFFIIPIIALMLDNASWIISFITPKTSFSRWFHCLAWMFSCIKYQCLILFLEQLTEKTFTLKLHHKIFFALESLLCCAFIGNTICLIYHNTLYPIVLDFYCIMTILWFIVTPMILKQVSNKAIPIVLKKQLQILWLYFLCPHLLCILLELLPIILLGKNQSLTFSNLATIFITASLYYCFKRIMQFRFLNLSKHVQNTTQFKITTGFKDTIEHINVASNSNEIEYIIQAFFQEQFLIQKQQVNVYIRSDDNPQKTTQTIIENFINSNPSHYNINELFLQHKILVRHEIEFDEFHTNSSMISHLCQFLKDIDCDLFIPILKHKKLVGYVTVKKDLDIIYNEEQQNKMIVLAQFLAPALYLLQQNNIYTLLQETKEIKEELYAKHQEINQYKESIKTLLKDRVENHIGVIFFKNKHFTFKNAEAQNLLGFNPNLQHNHPTTAILTHFAQQVEKYQTSQSTHITISNGTKLIISGMPHAGPYGGAMLIIRNPEATDIIRMQLDALQDHSKRDYLLYLETTKAGKFINKLLPGNQEIIINTKIQLLQAALQQEALLLEMHQNDIDPIIEIIHQISEKETMHILTLQQGQQHAAIKIFGINQLLEVQHEQPLIEKQTDGILVIKNIEFLDSTSQQMLAYFIRYGIYTPLKSEQRKFSNARIICSTSHTLQTLFQDNMIIPELYQEFKKKQKKSIINMPSLITMNYQDLSLIIDGFVYQNLHDAGNKNFTPLTYSDKDTLIEKRIPSLFEFKQKIQTLMMNKTHEDNIETQTIGNPELFNVMCPELQLAAQLGRHALKDTQLMTTLWKKLGSQTKIAELLGVNRSSVNRRCKDYNLI